MENRSACEVFVTHDELAACCALVTEITTAEETLVARQMASDVLAVLSGWTVFGICEATVRPQGVLLLDRCTEAIPLTWPVRSIESIFIDGVELLPEQYAIVDSRYVIRRDGLGWPCHQNLAKTHLEVCSFEIIYTFGTDIPYQARLGAQELACDYFLGCNNGGVCELPRTVNSINTQGLSMSLDDAAGEVAGAVSRGSFLMVKEFLSTVNPRGDMGTEVYSPDMPKLRRVVYPQSPS